MAGEQEWVVKPSQGGAGLALYNPASGQCLVTDSQDFLTLGICGGRETAVWKQEEVEAH